MTGPPPRPDEPAAPVPPGAGEFRPGEHYPEPERYQRGGQLPGPPGPAGPADGEPPWSPPAIQAPGYPAADSAAPPPPGRDSWAMPLLVCVGVGAAVAVALGVYGRVHEPAGFSVDLAGFSSGLYVKAWLTTLAALLGVVQLLSAGVLYGKIRVGAAVGASMAMVHRWSGRIAVIATMPVMVHCLFALGFDDYSARVLAHSLMGCAFYGAFVAKMLALSRKGLPNWAVPALGAALFVMLTGLWLTSALWVFGTTGVHF